MKSSDEIDTTSKLDKETLVHSFFTQLGLYEEQGNYQSILSVLKNDQLFQSFLNQTPGMSPTLPTSQNLSKLHKYLNCKIIQDCSELVDLFYNGSLKFHDFISQVRKIVTNYNNIYKDYNSYIHITKEDILVDETVSDNYYYVDIPTGNKIKDGEREISTRIYGEGIYGKPIKLISDIQHAIPTQAELIELINNQIDIYRGKVKLSHDLHDQKIYVLQVALRVLTGDFTSMSRDKERKKITPKELVEALDLCPKAFDGKDTKKIINLVIDYTHAYSSILPITKYTPEAIKARDSMLQTNRSGDVQSILSELVTLSHNVDAKQIILLNPIDLTESNLTKYDLIDTNTLRLNQDEKTFVDLSAKINKLIKKYDGSSDELHIHKLNLMHALQKFITSPINNASLQALMHDIKVNYKCLEGSSSESKNLLYTVLDYMEINELSIAPWKTDNQMKDVLNDLISEIDSVDKKLMTETTDMLNNIERKIVDITNNHDHVLSVMSTAEIELNNLITINKQNEENELKLLGSNQTETSSTAQYNRSVRIINYRKELQAQIKEILSSINNMMKPDAILEKLDGIKIRIGLITGTLSSSLENLKFKYNSEEYSQLSTEKLLAARDEVNKLSDYLFSTLKKYDHIIKDIIKEYENISAIKLNIADLTNKVNLIVTDNNNSETVQFVLQQALDRENNKLNEIYKKIDESYEEIKREDEVFFKEIYSFQKKYEVDFDTTYNVHQVLDEAQEQINITNENFDFIFGGLSEIGQTIIHVDDSALEKELAEITSSNSQEKKPKEKRSQNQMSQNEFNNLMTDLPKVSNVGLYSSQDKNKTTDTQNQNNEKTNKKSTSKKILDT